MLRGHESLIRLVGKRQRSISLQNMAASAALHVTISQSSLPEEKQRIEWAECPVCGKQIRADGISVNDHLDACLENGNRKKSKSVQLTLFQFESIKCKEQIGRENQQTPNCSPPQTCEPVDIVEAEAPRSEASKVVSGVDIQVTAEAGHENIDQKEASILSERALYNGCIETRIAGRKYHGEARCEVGMRVCLVREPQNLKDRNAIKVVAAEFLDGPPLGHIPRRIACNLSPLMDENVLQIEANVSAVSDDLSEASLNLICRETKDRTAGSPTKERELALSWDKALTIAKIDRGNRPKYQQNFLYLLETVLQRDYYLFSADELEFLTGFRSLSDDGQRLFVRLAQRKGPWFRVQNIAYDDVADIQCAVGELIGRCFFIAPEPSHESATDLLQLLTVQELRQLTCTANLMKQAAASAARRNELVASICDAMTSQQALSSASASSRLLTLILEMAGLCIRLSNTTMFLLWRLQRLFFLDGEQELRVFLLVDSGIINYPTYNCIRTLPVFATREALTEYEQALELAQIVDMSLEASQHDILMSSLLKARKELEQIRSNGETNHPFLSRFSAAWVYATICTLAVSVLEKERRYVESVDLLKKLLSTSCCPGRRGYWTIRLSINLEHLQRLEESLCVAEAGLHDSRIRGGDRITLQKRVLRLGKPPRRWKIPAYASMMKKKHKVVEITGRPLNSVPGMKSRFYGYDGQQCGVEELALQYYAGEDGGGWKGVHSEGGVWLTLFGLLLWDIIFSDVPDVFQTPFQNAPLDLDTDSFYFARSSLIESRLEVIRDGGAVEIITETWEGNQGTFCRGVNWEKYSLSELQTISVCIGGPGLSAICRLLAEDHANWTAGMPDLLLWRENQRDAKLVEVKGPGDRLSEQQTAWFVILSNANVAVELCKVSMKVD